MWKKFIQQKKRTGDQLEEIKCKRILRKKTVKKENFQDLKSKETLNSE